jgi:hypothetical protein
MCKYVRVLLSGAGLSVAAIAMAQQAPIIYPAKGQSPQQQQQDEGDCYIWSRQTTGIDPIALAGAAPPPQSGPSAGQAVVGTAAKGAVAGVAIGAIAGDAGKGAGIGAVVGGLAGARRAHMAQEQQAASAQSTNAGRQQALSTYYRAYGACLEGRGYTIR